MTDPTPAERAYELGILMPTDRAHEAKIATAIRAAVEAETERCVKKVAAFTKLSGSRKTALIAEICAASAPEPQRRGGE